MALRSIQYKNFVFPFNPESSGIKCDRAYIEHKYPELSNTELEDFGSNSITISGSGEFFGSNAYQLWNSLYGEYKKQGVGNVSHPIFTDVTRGLMVKLEASVEPRPNYIKYSFEIIADTQPTTNKGYVVIQNTSTATSSVGSNNTGNHGSLVHTVVKGECLSVICANYSKKYGVSINWKTIASNNGLSNPNLIFPGDKITISW